jgi:hypothetical protein
MMWKRKKRIKGRNGIGVYLHDGGTQATMLNKEVRNQVHLREDS